MKKTLLALSILATFVLAGCGGETKSSTDSKTPEAKPAVKVEEKKLNITKMGKKYIKWELLKKVSLTLKKANPTKDCINLKLINNKEIKYANQYRAVIT